MNVSGSSIVAIFKTIIIVIVRIVIVQYQIEHNMAVAEAR